MTIKKTVAATEEKSKSSGGFKERRRECFKNLKTIPTVNIKGKKYSTVNERHKHLLQYFPEARFNEEVLFHDVDRVIVKTELYISDTIYAVGTAEEFRESSFINKTSALENCSSSALGRCLAAFGLSGSEYASAEELTNALINQEDSIKDKIKKQTTETKLTALYSDWKKNNDSEEIEKLFKEQQQSIKKMEDKMSDNGSGKQKDWVLFPYDANNEKAIKIDFSGNVNLDNGNKGTILGVKGSSKDGNTKFVKVFAQVGVLFKGDDKFTGEMNYSEAGGHKGLIGWINESGNILSGYKNEPRPKQAKPQSKEIPF